jgi:uncharacterized membrane protein YphA (DoxX/SURF4 family)
MKILTIIARVILGLGFVVFGLNILLHFLPMEPPTPPPPLAVAFNKALMESHYMLVVGALQVIGGALLVIGRFVPLGLILLGPVIVNILLFHAFLMPEGIGPGLVVTALFLFLLWRYREAFIPLLRP